MDPSRNRLVSTAYFAIFSSLFCMYTSKSIYFEVVKFTWKMWNRKKNQISDIPYFYFSTYGHFCSKNCQFSMNFHNNSKNRNRKTNFSFDSAHCASFIKTGAKLRGHILSWKIPKQFLIFDGKIRQVSVNMRLFFAVFLARGMFLFMPLHKFVRAINCMRLHVINFLGAVINLFDLFANNIVN